MENLETFNKIESILSSLSDIATGVSELSVQSSLLAHINALGSSFCDLESEVVDGHNAQETLRAIGVGQQRDLSIKFDKLATEHNRLVGEMEIVKPFGSVSGLLNKYKTKKAEVAKLRGSLDVTKELCKIASNDLVGVKKTLDEMSGRYTDLASQYILLANKKEIFELRVNDCELLLSQKEAILNLYTQGGDFLYIFPNCLSSEVAGADGLKELQRTLLYLNASGVGGLVFLDVDGDAKMVSVDDVDIVVPESEVTLIFAKLWLTVVAANHGVMESDDLHMASFIGKSRRLFGKILKKKEVLKMNSVFKKKGGRLPL